MFRSKKVYGQSKETTCHFCGKIATTTNKQGMPACTTHKNNMQQELRCYCKTIVDIKEGKYGPFAVCPKCGIQKISRLIEMQPEPIQEKKEVTHKKNITKKSIHDMNANDAFDACFR